MTTLSLDNHNRNFAPFALDTSQRGKAVISMTLTDNTYGTRQKNLQLPQLIAASNRVYKQNVALLDEVARLKAENDALLKENAELQSTMVHPKDHMITVDYMNAEIERLKYESRSANTTAINAVRIIDEQKDDIEKITKYCIDLLGKWCDALEQVRLLENRLGIREEVEAGSLDSMGEPF